LEEYAAGAWRESVERPIEKQHLEKARKPPGFLFPRRRNLSSENLWKSGGQRKNGSFPCTGGLELKIFPGGKGSFRTKGLKWIVE
jgi:hypothetical protein